MVIKAGIGRGEVEIGVPGAADFQLYWRASDRMPRRAPITTQETIAAAGALSATRRVSYLALVGAGAVTLAAPDANSVGLTKIIEMTVDNGDVTLALTNVVGQSTGTTCTFNDVGDALILIARSNKWVVFKELGVSLA